MNITHRPDFLFKNNFSDTLLCIHPRPEIALSIGPNRVDFYLMAETKILSPKRCF
jgi:hypothetical protein